MSLQAYDRDIVAVTVPGHGDHYMFVEDYEQQSGPIFTNPTDPETFTMSYAHMFPDGVRRHRNRLCDADDVSRVDEVGG